MLLLLCEDNSSNSNNNVIRQAKEAVNHNNKLLNKLYIFLKMKCYTSVPKHICRDRNFYCLRSPYVRIYDLCDLY